MAVVAIAVDSVSAVVQDDEYRGDSDDDVISRGAAVTVITGLFLKSLETSGLFRVSQFPLYQSRFQAIKLPNPLGSSYIKNMLKNQLLKTSGSHCSFTSGLSRNRSQVWSITSDLCCVVAQCLVLFVMIMNNHNNHNI